MAKTESSGALTESTFYVLLCLHVPMHGYAIMQKVKDMTGGRVNLGAGTLYGILNALVEKDLIAELNGRSSGRRKEYAITNEGRLAFADEVKRLEALVRDARSIQGGN